MRESALSDNLTQKLSEFETIEDIQPSAGWNESLMNKLASVRTPATSKFSSPGMIVVFLFILLINIGFILKTIIRDPNRIMSRDGDLQTISSELLINPVSINK